MVLGDSLTDGYGVAKEAAYPALVGRKLKAAGLEEVEVVNAGISGSTSASAESRLRWHLKAKPQILLVALGANDGLRGVKLEETRRNLSRVIGLARESGIRVLLVGMKLPPNYGAEYTRGFERLYLDLSKEHRVPLIPFLLDGVGGERELNQADGIHPNEKGHEKMAENVFPSLMKMLKAR